MRINVHWTIIGGNRRVGWSLTKGLYAYLSPTGREILYIGKVNGTSIRQRWNARDKDALWDDLERQRGIYDHFVLAGLVDTRSLRFTRQILADIESLLIHRIRPWGNIQCRVSRIERPGLYIHCVGDWPYPQRTFFDAQP